MKKIIALLSVLVLSACSLAEVEDIVSSRKYPFKVWQTEKVFFYDRVTGEEFLSESKTITEEKIELGVVLVTPVDRVMVSSRTYRTDFYSVENVKVNKNAIMSSTFSPVRIKKDYEYQAFGETVLNNKRYMLVRRPKSKDILLINDDGEIFNRIGRMIGDRIVVLDIEFSVEPDDIIMMPSTSTRTETTEVLDGYELIYNGIRDNSMVFTYKLLGDMAMEDEFVFPLDTGVIEINNLRIQVLDVEKKKIAYTILDMEVPCKINMED